MTRALLTAALLLLVPRAVSADDGYHEPTIPEMSVIVDEVQPTEDVPVAPPLPPTIPEMIDAAAWRWGASASLLRRITWCESRWNTWAVSPWGDRGIAQFNRITWQEQAPLYGLPVSFDAAFDPELSLDLMAALVARGQSWRWRACL